MCQTLIRPTRRHSHPGTIVVGHFSAYTKVTRFDCGGFGLAGLHEGGIRSHNEADDFRYCRFTDMEARTDDVCSWG